MKFGKILVREAQSLLERGGTTRRFIDYAMLKSIIKHGSVRAVFDAALMMEVSAVHSAFEQQQWSFDDVFDFEEQGMTNVVELRRYAVLNYLAVFKIIKKADKCLGKSMNEALMPHLLNSAFIRSLVGSHIFVDLEHSLREADARAGEMCPVCLEPGLLADPATLTCGHVFCWSCLSKCAEAGHGSCPVCRTE